MTNLLPVWCKGKKGSDENHVARTYLSTKKTKTVTSTVFADDLTKDIKDLSDHTKRTISQFHRIKEIKEIIAENNNSLCIRVNWSKNANLFQARQEKGSYYHNIQSQLMLLSHISQVVFPLTVQYLTLNHAKLWQFGHL